MAFNENLHKLRVILVRHADREFIPTLPDHDQPLTLKGKRAALLLGQKLVGRLFAEPDQNAPAVNNYVSIIFHSPYLRCTQTAALLAQTLEPRAGIHSAAALVPASEEAVRWALNLIASNLAANCIIIVGHQPELVELGQRLCGDPLLLKNGEAAGLELAARGGLWQVGSAKLLWRIKG